MARGLRQFGLARVDRRLRVPRAALVLLLCLTAGGSWAADVVRLSFEDLPKRIAEGNLQVRAMELQRQAAEHGRGSLSRSFGPHVEMAGGYESFKTGDSDSRAEPYGAVEARVNLYRGGYDAAERYLREAERDVAKASALKTAADELSQARKAYWDLVYNRDMLVYVAASLERNDEILSSVRKRVDRGLTTATDIVEFQLHEAHLAEELRRHKQEIVLLETVLAPMLGYPVGTHFLTKENLQSVRPSDRPGVARSLEAAEADAQYRAAEAHARRSSFWRPSLDVYGGYALYTRRDREDPDREHRDDTFGGVRLSLPLFDGGSSLLLRRSFRDQKEAYQTQRRHAEAKTASDYRRLTAEWNNEWERAVSSDKKIALGEKYFQGTLEEYNRGVKNAPDVIGALERMISLQTEGAQRRRNARHMEAELLKLTEASW